MQHASITQKVEKRREKMIGFGGGGEDAECHATTLLAHIRCDFHHQAFLEHPP